MKLSHYVGLNVPPQGWSVSQLFSCWQQYILSIVWPLCHTNIWIPNRPYKDLMQHIYLTILFYVQWAPNWEVILHAAAAATQWFQFKFSWPKIYRLHYSYLTYELLGYINASLRRSRVGAIFATCKCWTRNNKNMKIGVVNILYKLPMLHNYIYVFLSVIYLQITKNKIPKIYLNLLHVRLV